MILPRPAALFLVTAVLLAQAPARVDQQVLRTIMFATLGLGADAVQDGQELVKQALRENPKNAEALVWKGVGEFTQAGVAFFEQDQPKGAPLLKAGLDDVILAVMLEPDNIYVRIPRGLVLMNILRSMPKDYLLNKPFTESARSDFQKVFDLQKDKLDTIGTHEVGELLQALGDLNSRQGKNAAAEQFYRLMQQRLPGTEYARRASKWLASKQPLPLEDVQCIGCHIAQ